MKPYTFKVTASRSRLSGRANVTGLPQSQKEYRRTVITIKADNRKQARRAVRARAQTVFPGWRVSIYRYDPKAEAMT